QLSSNENKLSKKVLFELLLWISNIKKFVRQVVARMNFKIVFLLLLLFHNCHLCNIKFLGNITFSEYLTQICHCVHSNAQVLYIKSMIFENVPVKFTTKKLGVEFYTLQNCYNNNLFLYVIP